MDTDYDVIVIGSGAAGLSAAVAAAASGASVLIVEADTQTGGSSRLSGGHFYAADTFVQQQAGVSDSAEQMFQHYMTLNQWLVEPAVVRKYCELSAPTLQWLNGLGVDFPVTGLYQSGAGTIARGHQPEGGGETVVQRLDARRQQLGVDMVLDTRVDSLLLDNGRVSGIRAGSHTATAGAVVIATGGFGANDSLLQEYYPQAYAAGDWRWYIGTDKAQGDGLALGAQVDAAVQGHNRGLLLVTPGFSRDLEVLLPDWLILVNRQGRRFTDETAPYTMLAGLIDHQEGPVWAVFDEQARAAAKPSPVSQAYWVADVLAQKADAGVIMRADTLTALAAEMGCHAAGLNGTVARYNTMLSGAQPRDETFFKKLSSQAQPIQTPPFYAAEVRPAIVCWTGTGLRINDACQVMSQAEQPVSGLFAAGETVGSLHGDRYIGGGGSFGPCIVFGKLAGENAALASKGNF